MFMPYNQNRCGLFDNFMAVKNQCISQAIGVNHLDVPLVCYGVYHEIVIAFHNDNGFHMLQTEVKKLQYFLPFLF